MSTLYGLSFLFSVGFAAGFGAAVLLVAALLRWTDTDRELARRVWRSLGNDLEEGAP